MAGEDGSTDTPNGCFYWGVPWGTILVANYHMSWGPQLPNLSTRVYHSELTLLKMVKTEQDGLKQRL